MSREALRSRVFLRSVLPLVEVMIAEQPALAKFFGAAPARIQIEVADSDVGAALCWTRGTLSVEQGVRAGAKVRCVFRDPHGLNSFFAGQFVLPRVVGLRHPLLILGATRLLSSLRILHPKKPPTRSEDQSLRVKLLLYLVTQALAELYRGGYPPMVELVDESPERVYQWTVTSAGIGAYLRMQRGRVKAGRGIYTKRRPFVHFVFPSVAAALSVLTATGSQMTGVRTGQVQTLGSPEYTRKISLLMQKVDELLQEG